MKAIFFIVLFFLSFTDAFSQKLETELDWDQNRHHEIGVDATGFIKQFTNLNGDFFSANFIPIYQFTYRYKTRFGNLRFAIGGNYSEQEFQNLFIGDSTIRKRMNNFISGRIGWEFKNEISKRWQVFYGVDFRPSFSYAREDALQYNFDYVIGQESKSKIMGFAPLLGFRFRLLPRLSLMTEASFVMNFQTTSNRLYYAPRYDEFPAKEDVKMDDLKSVYGSFNAPINVIIAFDL